MTFWFNGAELSYLRQQRNGAWANDRSVEVPIICDRLRRFLPERTLEIGNVVRQYQAGRHAVVDKYEVAEGVLNQDIVDFKPPHPYDLVVSISTFEHIGFDGKEPREPGKSLRALGLLRGWLAPGGEAWVTFPLGYNGELDAAWEGRTLGFDEEYFMRLVSPAEGSWEEGNPVSPVWEQVGRSAVVVPHPYRAAVLLVGVVRA
jgi:hypothetical protein